MWCAAGSFRPRPRENNYYRYIYNDNNYSYLSQANSSGAMSSDECRRQRAPIDARHMQVIDQTGRTDDSAPAASRLDADAGLVKPFEPRGAAIRVTALAGRRAFPPRASPPPG